MCSAVGPLVGKSPLLIQYNTRRESYDTRIPIALLGSTLLRRLNKPSIRFLILKEFLYYFRFINFFYIQKKIKFSKYREKSIFLFGKLTFCI